MPVEEERSKLKKCMYIFLHVYIYEHMGFPGGAVGDVKDAGSIPGSGRPLEEGMATYSSVLAWRKLWAEEPSGLYSP